MRILRMICVGSLALAALGGCKRKDEGTSGTAAPVAAPAPSADAAPPPADAALAVDAPAPVVDAAPADPLAAIDAALAAVEGAKGARARGEALCADRALRKLADAIPVDKPAAGADATAWSDAVTRLQELCGNLTAACTEDAPADIGTHSVPELRKALTAVQQLAAP